jgi:hypothetical protein
MRRDLKFRKLSPQGHGLPENLSEEGKEDRNEIDVPAYPSDAFNHGVHQRIALPLHAAKRKRGRPARSQLQPEPEASAEGDEAGEEGRGCH